MARFQYVALTAHGERVNGVVEGSDRALVLGKLGDQGLHPIDVREHAGDEVSGRAFRLGSVSRFRDVTLFTRELAWLLKAGMTLNQALEILERDGSGKLFAGVVGRMRTDIRKGRNFHDTLRESGEFSPYYISMVEAGEESGTLPSVLEQIAATREKEQKVRNQLVSSLLYPLLLTVLATGAIIFILTSVVPNIKDMILSSGAPVPDSAQLVINLSDWLIGNGKTVLIGVPLALLAATLLLGTSVAKRMGFSIATRLPVLGPILKKSAVLQFSRILGALLAAGVSLPDSLRLMRPSTSHREVETTLAAMEDALRRGDDFLAPIERSRFFPPLLARLLRVGHETGNLTPSVQQLTSILDEELDTSIKRALTLLEPAIILLLSLVVAFIITSLMGAIISINDLAI